MSQSTTDQLKIIDVRQPLRRAVLVVPVLLALLFGWYATRWYMGDFVAEFAPQLEDGRIETAMAAMNLAPDDPLPHWIVAGLKKRTLLPEELADAVRHYEEAVRLSPNDYRLWVDLGRTQEEVGDVVNGEKSLRRAVELAPFYANPRWHLGNLLLRAGKGEEGFEELRRAADADPSLRPQLFNVAWDVYGQNVDAIKGAIGNSADARSDFAVYLLGRQRLDEALSLWSTLSQAEKKERHDAGMAITKALMEQKRYRAALSVFNDVNPPEISARASQITNGGFEDDIETGETSIFNWQIKTDEQAPIAIDASTGHSSTRSLRIVFKASVNLSFSGNVAQLVIVEPGAQYSVECYARTMELRSAGAPIVEIVDASDGKTVLGTSEPLESGTHDWQLITVPFKTQPTTEAVFIRISRQSCGADAVCPILGTVWYDDFNLQSGGRAAEPGNNRSGNKARS